MMAQFYNAPMTLRWASLPSAIIHVGRQNARRVPEDAAWFARSMKQKDV
jgi:hypothetical protein